MDTNKPILIAAPAWLNAALEDNDDEPEGSLEDNQDECDSFNIPLGFV